MAIKFGYNQVNFELTKTHYLCGYAPIRKNEGHHDELKIKSNVFYDEEKDEYFMFTVLDVIGIDKELTTRVEKKLQKYLGDSAFNLYLLATHTHSGPSGMIQTNVAFKSGLEDIFGKFDDKLVERLSQKITHTITRSIDTLEDFTYSIYQNNIQKIGLDRHNPNNPIDNKMTTIEINNALGEKVILTNYSCHPTVLSHANRLASSDFLCSFYTKSQEIFQQTSFINGSSANVSTRFTRDNQSMEQAEIFGHSLYNQFLTNRLFLSESTKASLITSQKSSIVLKTKNLDHLSVSTLEDEKEKLTNKLPTCDTDTDKRLLMAEIEGIRASINMKNSLSSVTEIDVSYWFFKLDDFLCLLIPGEITSHLTESIRNQTGAVVYSMVNDYLFYFAEEAMFEDNTYEAQSSFFEKGEAEKMMRKIENEIKFFTCYNKMI